MSPSSRQSASFLPPGWTEEPNSDPFWIDRVACSAFHEETPRLFEGVTTSLKRSGPLSTDHPPLPLDDDGLSPPTFFGGAEGIDDMFLTFPPSTMSFGARPDELFYHICQAISDDAFQDKDKTCLPPHAMGVYEVFPHLPALHDDSVDSITQALSHTHLPSEPVNFSTMMTAYTPSFDYSCDSQIPSTLERASVVSPPTRSSASASHHNSSRSDGEGDADYYPPSDDEERWPTQAASVERKGRKVRVRAKSTSTQPSTSESEKSTASSRGHQRPHPYKQPNRSRNFQRQDGARLINTASEFQCPVAGCDHTQKNLRIPDLKRHVATHERWTEPERWTCCGVEMERAHLYGRGITVGMSKEEQIKAGAYEFKGKLMIGGCLNTFSRRDALKRHVDNPKISCVGDMHSYFY